MKKSISNYTKEELELLSYKDITYLILKEQKATNTADLFRKIMELLGLTNKDYEAKIGDYYTSLTTDKRFIMLEDGCWDLRDRHKSDKIIKIDDEDDDDEMDEMESEEDANTFDSVDDENYEDTDDDLKDLVVIDEDEMDME